MVPRNPQVDRLRLNVNGGRLDDHRMADAKVGAAQFARHPLMLAGEPLDVGFVDDGTRRLYARLADPQPVEGVIHQEQPAEAVASQPAAPAGPASSSPRSITGLRLMVLRICCSSLCIKRRSSSTEGKMFGAKQPSARYSSFVSQMRYFNG